MIPYGRQEITQEDIDSVVSVLKSDFLTQGKTGPHFEELVAKQCKAKHALAVSSATSALHIACLALDLGHGDWLWTSPVTFVASANCGLYCGARVDFVDIDARTYNICPKALETKLIEARQQKRLPKVIVVVHLAGQPCDMMKIHNLSKQFGFKIIEDASHAIGGKYCNEPIGNCRYSDITVFSFHPVKIITTAEGGMTLTNNAGYASRMELLRSHGVTRNSGLMTGKPDGPWYYQQVELGFNYRMTELQAALGVSQVARLDEYVARRHALAQRYNSMLLGLPIITPFQSENSYSGYHLYILCIDLENCKKSHLQVFESLRASEVGVNLHYIPVHLQPYYRNMGFSPGDFPQAELYYSRAISLPLYPTMTDETQDIVIDALHEALF